MFGKNRVLPFLAVAATLLLALKLGGIWLQADAILTGASTARAQESAEQAESGEPEAATADDGAGTADEEAVAGDLGNAPSGSTSGDDFPDDPALYTKAEIEVLQNLANRRKVLEERGRELEMRENLLRVTETRIDEKISSLKVIEHRIEGLLQEHDAQKEQRFKRLVKVYESMKPKDAARIFNTIDMSILLEVAERMKEVKMALILAKMDDVAAKAVTIEMANRRRLPVTGS